MSAFATANLGHSLGDGIFHYLGGHVLTLLTDGLNQLKKTLPLAFVVFADRKRHDGRHRLTPTLNDITVPAQTHSIDYFADMGLEILGRDILFHNKILTYGLRQANQPIQSIWYDYTIYTGMPQVCLMIPNYGKAPSCFFLLKVERNTITLSWNLPQKEGNRFMMNKLAMQLLIQSALLFAAASPLLAAEPAAPAQNTPWDQIRPVKMQGGLRAFWNVHGGDNDLNNRQAVAHGFELVDILNTYSDYPGRQKENINTYIKNGHRTNPWRKPDFFERIIRRNIAGASTSGAIFVHDIEFPFEDDIDKAWADPAARADSRAATRDEFAKAYFKEWASWFALPCAWAHQQFPGKPVGIYGPQPFRRDYWGLAGKDAQQIDGTHQSDAELWRAIDPTVDFTIASVYVFYEDPGSIFYVASNIEENVKRTRQYGSKPLYAYEWLRYHDSNKKLGNRELAPWIVEAMAVLPYFCGARGVVLWGSERKLKGQYYAMLPTFMSSLGRVADLSEKIANAKPLDDEPVHVAWKARRPLIRRLRVGSGEWLVLAVNPWQDLEAKSTMRVDLEGRGVDLELRGRHTEIYQVSDAGVKRM